jgi:hypothetical protein
VSASAWGVRLKSRGQHRRAEVDEPIHQVARLCIKRQVQNNVSIPFMLIAESLPGFDLGRQVNAQ